MTGPPAATAACRLAVRRSLADHDGPVLAAVSGGADSLALAAALAFERPGSGALVVDHALQPGSAEVAARAAAQCTSLGLSAQVLTAQVLTAAGTTLASAPPAECGDEFPGRGGNGGNYPPHSRAGGPEACAGNAEGRRTVAAGRRARPRAHARLRERRLPPACRREHGRS